MNIKGEGEQKQDSQGKRFKLRRAKRVMHANTAYLTEGLGFDFESSVA